MHSLFGEWAETATFNYGMSTVCETRPKTTPQQTSRLLMRPEQGTRPKTLQAILLLLLLSLSLSPLYRIFTCMSPRQTMSLGDTLLQLLFRFIVSTVYGAYLPRSYVGSHGLLRQHFPENVCSA